MRNFLLLAVLALTSAHAAQTPDAPRGYVAGYDLLRNGKVEGRAEVTLAAQDDGRWEMRNATRGTRGLPALVGFRIDERSLLRWRNGVPTTLGYEYRQRTAFKKRERALKVDPDNGRIVSRDGKREYVLEYRDDVLDRQSVSLALAHDIAHGANPGTFDHDGNPGTPRINQTADADDVAGEDDGNPGTYDDELLEAHFLTGDGRGNENIGLTAVHTIFHAEHNRLVGAIQSEAIAA